MIAQLFANELHKKVESRTERGWDQNTRIKAMKWGQVLKTTFQHNNIFLYEEPIQKENQKGIKRPQRPSSTWLHTRNGSLKEHRWNLAGGINYKTIE